MKDTALTRSIINKMLGVEKRGVKRASPAKGLHRIVQNVQECVRMARKSKNSVVSIPDYGFYNKID